MKRQFILIAVICATMSHAQENALRLDSPAPDSAGSLSLSPTKVANRKPLGYEGTSMAAKKDAEPKPKGQTEITALEATFDQKTREAVFIGQVVVKDPEFTVACDRLTAFLKKQNEAKEKPAANPPPAAKPANGTKAENKGGGLEKAVAESNEGNEVVITQEKLEPDGNVTLNIGRARKTTYDAATGDIILTGSPSVQQGINTCVATDDSTIMTLNRNGRMKVKGPHRNVIKDTNSADTIR